VLYILINILLLTSLSPGNDEIKIYTEAVITETFGSDISFGMTKYVISLDMKSRIESESKQKFIRDHVFIWNIFENDSTVGTAILDHVYGKNLPITFLVIFDNEENIKRTAVVKYREPYGTGVKSNLWNQQFEGKNYLSELKIGADINMISGATISSRSVTTGIKKLALLYHYMKEN